MKIFRSTGLLLLFFACAQTSVMADREANLNSAETTINGITILASEKEIIELLGEPRSVDYGQFMPPENLPTKTIYYDGYNVFLVDGVVFGFDCALAECKTNLDVYVGDVISKVKNVYGDGIRVVNDSGNTVLSYQLEDINVSLKFLFDGKQVSHIRLIRHLR